MIDFVRSLGADPHVLSAVATRIAGSPCDLAALDFPTVEDGARGVAVSADGKSAYVASRFSDAVAVFDRNATTGATGVANSGSVLVGPGVYDRDVPRVTGSETQIFLKTPDGEPASITVLHHAGAPSHWGVSFSEVVATRCEHNFCGAVTDNGGNLVL